MKYFKKISSACCAGLIAVALSSCEGSELYNVLSPDWLSDKIDEIAAANKTDLSGMMEDVYTIGASDYSSGWWQAFSKYYVVPAGEKWVAQFNLNINPDATAVYKNFALVFTNDSYDAMSETLRNELPGYFEYGVIRYDNRPAPGNSEWGNYIDRGLITSTLTFDSDTSEGIEKLGGKVTLTVDRTDGGLSVKIDNGTVEKTYTQTTAWPDEATSTENIRCFLVTEGSYIDFLSTNIEPIGGCTSAEDKQPLSMTLNGVPKKVLQSTGLSTDDITATVEFEEGVTKTVSASELTFQTVPDATSLGTKTIVAIYNKTFKGLNTTPIIATATYDVVDKMYTAVGALDNSDPLGANHSDNIKLEPGATYVTTFTNYTDGKANWDNFYVELFSSTGNYYATVRADNWGWGTGYDACTHEGDQGDWATWLTAMDGAKVTVYATNNGDGTADVKAVMVGNNGQTYTQTYKGINNIDVNDCYVHLTVEKAHIEFDQLVGAEDNSDPLGASHSENLKMEAGKSYVVNFTNYTDGKANWDNFYVELFSSTGNYYATVRSDNWGWGTGYDACTHEGNQGDWATWLAAMDGAKVTVYATLNSNGTADVKAVMVGNNGQTYTQTYQGINNIDVNDCYFHLTVEKAHIAIE